MPDSATAPAIWQKPGRVWEPPTYWSVLDWEQGADRLENGFRFRYLAAERANGKFYDDAPQMIDDYHHFRVKPESQIEGLRFIHRIDVKRLSNDITLFSECSDATGSLEVQMQTTMVPPSPFNRFGVDRCWTQEVQDVERCSDGSPRFPCQPIYLVYLRAELSRRILLTSWDEARALNMVNRVIDKPWRGAPPNTWLINGYQCEPNYGMQWVEESLSATYNPLTWVFEHEKRPYKKLSKEDQDNLDGNF